MNRWLLFSRLHAVLARTQETVHGVGRALPATPHRASHGFCWLGTRRMTRDRFAARRPVINDPVCVRRDARRGGQWSQQSRPARSRHRVGERRVEAAIGPSRKGRFAADAELRPAWFADGPGTIADRQVKHRYVLARSRARRSCPRLAIAALWVRVEVGCGFGVRFLEEVAGCAQPGGPVGDLENRMRRLTHGDAAHHAEWPARQSWRRCSRAAASSRVEASTMTCQVGADVAAAAATMAKVRGSRSEPCAAWCWKGEQAAARA